MERLIERAEQLFNYYIGSFFVINQEREWLIDEHPIHVCQTENWDCGVACCAMVLKWLEIPLEILYNHDIATRKSPLWTIDLFLFLIDASVNANMYTITMGIDAHHSNYDWYNDNFNTESPSVHSDINDRYTRAHERMLPISKVISRLMSL
jgi:hypothetical protein